MQKTRKPREIVEKITIIEKPLTREIVETNKERERYINVLESKKGRRCMYDINGGYITKSEE